MPAPADLQRRQRVDQRLLRRRSGARRVDQIAGRLHELEFLLAIRPRVRSLSTRWIVTMSARVRSAILAGDVADADSVQRSRGQVLAPGDIMPKAKPILATAAPSRPRPITPSRRTFSPDRACAASHRCACCGLRSRCGADRARISAQVSSTVGKPCFGAATHVMRAGRPSPCRSKRCACRW